MFHAKCITKIKKRTGNRPLFWAFIQVRNHENINWIMPKKQIKMRFCPVHNMPETHTVTVIKTNIGNERRKNMLIREFVQNPAFDVNCYVKIFDCTKKAGWKGKIPVYDGPGSPVYAPEDILSMELSRVTTDQNDIILKGIRKDRAVPEEEPEAQLKGHKEEVQKALQALYDAAYQVNQITDEDDYEQFPDLLDESANVTNEFKNLGIVEDGIVSL